MRNRKHILLFLLLAAVTTTAFAKDDYQSPFSIVKIVTTLRVAADASYETVTEYRQKIETPVGAQDYGEIPIEYSGSQETLEVLEAYTLQPDGKRINVPESAIMDKGDAIGESASMFSDTRQKVIIYPDVRPGSQLYFKTRLVRHTAEFPGHFIYEDYFSPHYRSGHEEINLIVSDKLPVHIDTKGMQGGRLPDKNGYQHYRYVFKQETALPTEPSQVNYRDFAPYFMASTFVDQAALGRAYQERAKPMTKVTPAIQKLADAITLNTDNKREQAKALYHWVAKNIRYVSISLGSGGLVPRPAQATLDNRYGDCKDYVALLEALLDAKGIESSPALINLGDAYQLPKLAVISPMNHVITYIPSLDLYLDATAQFAPFGALPEEDMDKPVILTALNRLGRTPILRASDHLLKSEVRLRMLADGSIEGTSATKATGWWEAGFRQARFNSMHSPNDSLIRGRLSDYKETGAGKILSNDPHDFDQPYGESTSFTLDPLSNIPGPAATAIPVGPLFYSLADIKKPRDQLNFPDTCGTGTMQEHYVLEFPNNIRIKSIPVDANYDNGVTSYTSRYKLDGLKLDVTRELQTNRLSMVCG
ncbi:MAG: hypothetical protein RL610_1469, partial [Pseudomonadota bacterium]